MTFNSLTFLIFFGIVLAIHNLPISWRSRKFNLVVFSYLFYAAWNPPFVILLWISTAVDWWVSGNMARSTNAVRRRALLIVSLSTNLGLLAVFIMLPQTDTFRLSPAKTIASEYLFSLAGWEVIEGGGMTVRVASLLVSLPKSFLTTQV